MKPIILTLPLILLPFFVVILPAQTSSVLQLPNSNSNTYCFTTSEDSKVLYYVNENWLTQYDLVQNETTKTIDIQSDGPVVSMLVHASTNTIFLGIKTGKLLAISKETGELFFEKDYKSWSVNALALTGDERNLLIGLENGLVFKQSIEEVSEVSKFYQHGKAITSIEVSKDKQLIAISSADGRISLFRDLTYEWMDELLVGKEWVRKVSINNKKERLLCVGDEGTLYEWNISDIEKARLIKQTRVSRNWLLSLDIGIEGDVECWGGLDHLLKVRTHFGTYEKKLKGPILKTKFLWTGTSEVLIATCILGKGIQIVSLKEMKFRSIFK